MAERREESGYKLYLISKETYQRAHHSQQSNQDRVPRTTSIAVENMRKTDQGCPVEFIRDAGRPGIFNAQDPKRIGIQASPTKGIKKVPAALT